MKDIWVRFFQKNKKFLPQFITGFIFGLVFVNLFHLGANTILFLIIVTALAYTFPEQTKSLLNKAVDGIKKLLSQKSN